MSPQYYICNITARNKFDKRGIILCSFVGTKKEMINNMIAWNIPYPNTIIIVGKAFAKKILPNINIDVEYGSWPWPLPWPK
jgi:hypothetical protein